jgi:hypothetical protein
MRLNLKLRQVNLFLCTRGVSTGAECRLLLSLLELQNPDINDTTEKGWERAVTRLDMAIIIVGAPGDGRLDLVLDAIEVIQTEQLPLSEDSQYLTISVNLELPLVNFDFLASSGIPRISPPSVATFQRFSSMPFILPGFIKDWPALTNHPWSSPAYLLRIPGRGRVVPVEVGSEYRAEDWSQKILPWKAFLQGIVLLRTYTAMIMKVAKMTLTGMSQTRRSYIWLNTLSSHNFLLHALTSIRLISSQRCPAE